MGCLGGGIGLQKSVYGPETQNADLDPACFVFACMERTPKDLMQSSLTPNSDAGADTVFKDR